MNGDTLYEKRGRRYHPVAQRYDVDALPFGTWLLTTTEGSKAFERLIEPASAELAAAMRIAMSAMVEAMHKASELRPQQTPITPEQRRLLDELASTGFNASIWTRASLHDVAQAGIDALELK
jgi:hypothetical protein